MIARQPALSAADRLLLDRQHAISEALSLTTSGLSPRAEQDIRSAVMRHLDPLLDLADDAVAARVELDALDGRLDRHQAQCPSSVPLQTCLSYRLAQIHRKRLLATYDRAFRALLIGRR